MNKSSPLFLAILTVSAGGFIFAAEPLLAPTSSEPVYKGKPISYWVAALEPSQSVSAEAKQAEAEEAIHTLGPDAIPSILRYRGATRQQRLDVIRHACNILAPEGDVKLLDACNDADASVRETALEVLPKTTMPAAMDDMMKLLTDPARPVRNAAVLALLRLAPDREETVSALVEALHEKDSGTNTDGAQFSREDAALALAKLGPKAKAAIPELTSLLEDPNDRTRESAAVALWKIERNPIAIATLAECLEMARDYQTCLRVMKTLAEIGPAAKLAVPALKHRIEDPGVTFAPPNVDIGKSALDALGKIDPSAVAQAKKKLEDLSKENQ